MKTILLILCSVSAAFTQIVPGRYVVQLTGEPAAALAAKRGTQIAAQPAAFAAHRDSVRRSQTAARLAVRSLGGSVLDSMDTVMNALIVNVPDAQAAALANLPGVLSVQQVRRVHPLLSHALPLHKVTDAWNMLPQGQNSAGAGIKIAMIDSGIDVTHPAFSDSLPPLAGFPKTLRPGDLQFTNAKIIVAKNYTLLLPDGGDPDADDHDGHGTGTAMAAAGGQTSSQYGPMSGVAPKAYLGSYKVLDAKGGTNDVIAKAIDDAVADGFDVISISLGAPVLSYSDIGAADVGQIALSGAARAGVVVVVAAGNSGPAAGTIADYPSSADVISVGAISNDRSLGDSVLVSGAAPLQAFSGDGPEPAQALTGPLFDVTAVDPTGLTCTALPAGSVNGQIVLIQRGSCTFENKINNAEAGGAIAALIYDSPTGNRFSSFSQSVGAATLPNLFTNLTEGKSLKDQIAANPGLQATLDFNGVTAFPARPDLVDFSSRGPNIGSALKPDLTAVGFEIVTGAQHSYTSGESYDASGFTDTAGTSFSAPLVSGAAAILKGARPGLTVQQYRSLLINSASPVTSAPGIAASVQQAGAGMLNLASAMTGTVTAYPTSLNFGTGQGSVNNTVNLALSNTGTASDTYTITVLPSNGGPAPSVIQTVQIDSGSTQQVPVSVSASNLAPGEYYGYLQVTGTNNPAVATIPYWYAVPGSDPADIAVIKSDFQDPIRSLSTKAVVIRVVDLAGLPYTGPLRPAFSIPAGQGTIRSQYAAGDIPGTYAIDVRTGSGIVMTVNISIVGISTSVLIGLF